MFADDANIFVHGKDSACVTSEANTYLSQLNDWFVINKLILSLDKTCYTIFYKKPVACLDIVVNGIKIQRVNSCKYLGVIIDSELKWKDHIEYVHKKLIKYTSIFYKLRTKLSIPCLRSIYYAFIYPHLLYGIEIYANTYQSHLHQLNVLNNKILRILQSKPLKTSLQQLYWEFQTLPISLLHRQQILILVHCFFHHNCEMPEVYHDYFTVNSTVHNYGTRQSGNLHIELTKLSLGHRSVHYTGSVLWNELPLSLKEPMSKNTFKLKLKRHLLGNLNST